MSEHTAADRGYVLNALLTRAWAGDLDVRSTASGRVIEGIAVPWGEVAEVSDDGGRTRYREMWERGAFARTIRERPVGKVRAMVNHDTRPLAIGRAVHLAEVDAGLECALQISKTRAGDEALELVRDGVVDSLSIGFRGDGVRHERGLVVRTSAALREISLVNFPSFSQALITAIRNADQPRLHLARHRLALARVRAGRPPFDNQESETCHEQD